MNPLSIQLAEVKETPRRFSLAPDAAWWTRARELLREPEADLRRPFALELEGYRMGARLLFRGRLSGEAELVCGFCLDPYGHAFDEPLELLLEPAPAHAAQAEGTIELDAEDLELGRYAGDELDFEPVLGEILALAWPMQPRCSEGCRGLCAVCGINRNRETCACAGRDASHPFAELGRLLERSRGGR